MFLLIIIKKVGESTLIDDEKNDNFNKIVKIVKNQEWEKRV